MFEQSDFPRPIQVHANFPKEAIAGNLTSGDHRKDEPVIQRAPDDTRP